MPFAVKLDGVQKVLKRFAHLKAAVKNRALRKALTAASKAVQADARAAAPRRSGALRASIKREVKTYRTTGNTEARVGPDRRYLRRWKGGKVAPHRYAHLVEKGRKSVRPVSARALAIPAASRGRGRRKGPAVVLRRRAAAVAPRPFLGRAWRKNKAAVQAGVVAELRRALSEAAQK